MKNVRLLLSITVLFLAVFSVPLTSANNAGPSSNGDFSFVLEDGAGCQSFSLAAFTFDVVKHGAGNIQVKP